MGEIGRAGWFMLGVTAMALAALGHAVTGAAHIARGMVRAPQAEPGPGPASAGRDEPVDDSGLGGWILFSALVMAGGATYHAIAGTRQIIREVLHTSPVR